MSIQFRLYTPEYVIWFHHAHHAARNVSGLPANPQMLSHVLNATALPLFGIAYENFKTHGERQIRVARAPSSRVQKEVA